MADLAKYYKILSIEPRASKEEIYQAYQRMLNAWNPETFEKYPWMQERAKGETRKIHEAYEELSKLKPSTIQKKYSKLKRYDLLTVIIFIIIGGIIIGGIVIGGIYFFITHMKTNIAVVSDIEKKQAEVKMTESERLSKAIEWVEKGKRQQSNKDYDGAIEAFTNAISMNPELADAYIYRGTAYFTKENYDKAIEDLSRAIAINPGRAASYTVRGAIYGEKKKYDLAIDDYNRAVALNPDSDIILGAYYGLAHIYNKTGQYDKAIEDCNRAIAIDYSHAGVLYERGFAYLSLKLTQKTKKITYNLAIEDFSKAIALDPDYAKAYLFRGISYKMAGQSAKSTHDFQKACGSGLEEGCESLR